MESLSLAGLLYLGSVVVLSYSIRGSAGFGGATVPLLALALSLKIVVPLVTFLGLLSSVAILARDHRYIAWRDTLRILPYCFVGSMIGLYFFTVLDARTLGYGLAVLVIAYGSVSFLSTLRPLAGPRLPLKAVVPVAGTTAGFIGSMFGAMAGIFFAIYLDILKFAKHEFRATMAAILFALGLFRGAGYLAIGAYDRETLIACAAALPLMAVGIFIGQHIHANLNQVAFRRFVALVMIGSGVPLLLR
jgi:uncharacterized membrane protein YfcA